MTQDVTVIVLTEDERALIMGTLLGDAHLQKRKNSYRLKIAHGVNQKEYVFWKHKKLKNVCKTTRPPKTVTSNKGFTTVYFYTSSGLWLEEFHRLFYKKKGNRYVKTITPELIESLPMNPLVLAMFFMDDGSVRNDCKAGKLATQCFSKTENLLLCSYFQKWNIECNVVFHLERKNQYYITIPAATFGNLVAVIAPIVREIPDMVYKLND